MIIEEAFKKLNESKDLYKGVFWIRNPQDATASKDLMFQIPCTSDGNSCTISIDGASKNGKTFNHERLWAQLSKKVTGNKPFDYYPRGRVEIQNGIADIYVNPNLMSEEIQELLISEYNLTKYNGIKKIRFHADHSEHYKSYLD